MKRLRLGQHFSKCVKRARLQHCTRATSLFENSCLAQCPRPVAVRSHPAGCFLSCERSETLTRLDISPDLPAGQAHHQLGDVVRTLQTLKRLAEKIMKSTHNSAKNRSCHVSRACTVNLTESQATVRSSGRPVWQTEATDSTDPIRMEQTKKIERTQRTCICKHVHTARSWSLFEADTENTSDST